MYIFIYVYVCMYIHIYICMKVVLFGRVLVQNLQHMALSARWITTLSSIVNWHHAINFRMMKWRTLPAGFGAGETRVAHLAEPV